MATTYQLPKSKNSIPKELQDKLNKVSAKIEFVTTKGGIVQLDRNNPKDREWYEDDQGFESIQ